MRASGKTGRLVAAGLLVLAGALLQGASFSDNLPDSQQVIAFLNQTIDWYRHVGAEQHLADQPAEVLFVYNDRQLANQILTLSFDYARGAAQLIASQNPSTDQASSTAGPSRIENIEQLAAKAEEGVHQKQAELDTLKQKLPSTQGRAHTVLESTITETQSDLELLQTRRDTLRNVLQFATGSATKKGAKGDLLAQIGELEQSVPEARSTLSNNGAGQEQLTNSAPTITVPGTSRQDPSGILGLSSDLWASRNKIHELDDTNRITDELAQATRSAMSPFVSTLQEAARQADDLTNQPPASDSAVISQRTNDINALEARFKQYSSIFLPLAKQSILLDRYKAGLTTWRDTVESHQKAEFKSLAVRLITLGIILIIAIGISELWRRLTIHYIPDVRRRHQFLLVRRIVMFFVFAIIIAFSFSTDLGSLTTFAGLIVAGLAVSLQNVIQSAVGYFVLLGKYGVRVGDRIQIAGTTGNVVDVDLMRLSLMELDDSGTGIDGMPTGRTVEFPNAIVFQPTAGFFKQIPGTNFSWHEVTLTLATDSDYGVLEKRILKAVDAVFATYRDNLEQQYRSMEQTLNLSVEMPHPQSRLRFTQSALEMIIRYPVTSEHTAEIDDQITRALLNVMKSEPEVKAVASSATTVQSSKGASPAETKLEPPSSSR
jgi:small-conductance mechanosensitive channel